MAIDKEISVQIVKERERSFGFGVRWPMENPLPFINATREKVALDAEGKRVGESPREERALDALKIRNATYTRPDGSTFQGTQTIADVSLILDVECADFFTPPA